MKRKPSFDANTCIVLICALITLLIHFLPLGNLNQTERAILLGAYYKPFILAGEGWRLITVGFVHVSFLHLAMNLYSLLILGRLLEHWYGTFRYLVLLFASVLGGSLFMFMTQGNTIAVGLSGGLYGLMAAYILLLVKNGNLQDRRLQVHLLELIGLNVLINFLPNVGVSAHLGGFVTGTLLGILLDPHNCSAQMKKNTWIASAVLLIVLGMQLPKTGNLDGESVYAGTDLKILLCEKQMGFSAHAVRMGEHLEVLYGLDGFSTILKEGEYE